MRRDVGEERKFNPDDDIALTAKLRIVRDFVESSEVVEGLVVFVQWWMFRTCFHVTMFLLSP